MTAWPMPMVRLVRVSRNSYPIGASAASPCSSSAAWRRTRNSIAIESRKNGMALRMRLIIRGPPEWWLDQLENWLYQLRRQGEHRARPVGRRLAVAGLERRGERAQLRG